MKHKKTQCTTRSLYRKMTRKDQHTNHNENSAQTFKKLKVTALAAIIIATLHISHAEARKKIILISWDGTDYSVIARLLANGMLPNLQSLGTLHKLTDNTDCFPGFKSDCSCMQTSTIPQHATMLTGLLANSHGITSNNCYRQIPADMTIYHRFSPKIKTAHIASKAKALGEPVYGNIKSTVTVFDIKDKESTAEATDKAIALLHKWSSKDFFIFLHLGEPDATGHAAGSDSPQYATSLTQNDFQLGRIKKVLKAKGIFRKTTIYVLSDHGFGKPRKNSHSGTPQTFIVSNNPSVTDLTMADITATVLRNYKAKTLH